MAEITLKNKKECECGCGQYFLAGKTTHGIEKRFIHGHNKGHSMPHTNEAKYKMKLSHKGLPAYNKGLFATKESKEKNRIAHLGRKASEETKYKMSIAKKGRKYSEEIRKNMSEAKRNQSEDTRRKIGEKHKGKIISQEQRNQISIKLIGRTISEDIKQKTRKTMLELWKDPEYVKKVMNNANIRPNKPETIILNLLENLFPGEWKYTGDFSFMINGKNPDFVNCNGQKKIIELFGDYFHKGQNPQDRIDVFKPFGYETLVIWESELKNLEKVSFKLCSFCKEADDYA